MTRSSPKNHPYSSFEGNICSHQPVSPSSKAYWVYICWLIDTRTVTDFSRYCPARIGSPTTFPNRLHEIISELYRYPSLEAKSGFNLSLPPQIVADNVRDWRLGIEKTE
ncbi:MAG TPA: hypothetical protein V6C91_16430 [Coleofasciculaceae cyanobacterium]